MLTNWLTIAVVSAHLLALGPNCKKGKRCGNTCIAAHKTCHVGTYSRPITPRPSSTPAAPATRVEMPDWSASDYADPEASELEPDIAFDEGESATASEPDAEENREAAPLPEPPPPPPVHARSSLTREVHDATSGRREHDLAMAEYHRKEQAYYRGVGFGLLVGGGLVAAGGGVAFLFMREPTIVTAPEGPINKTAVGVGAGMLVAGAALLLGSYLAFRESDRAKHDGRRFSLAPANVVLRF